MLNLCGTRAWRETPKPCNKMLCHFLDKANIETKGARGRDQISSPVSAAQNFLETHVLQGFGNQPSRNPPESTTLVFLLKTRATWAHAKSVHEGPCSQLLRRFLEPFFRRDLVVRSTPLMNGAPMEHHIHECCIHKGEFKFVWNSVR